MLIEEEVEVRSDNLVSERSTVLKKMSGVNENEILIELGIWLTGLESFLASGHHSFSDSKDIKEQVDASKEFRLIHYALQRSSMLNARLLSADRATTNDVLTSHRIKLREMIELSNVLRQMTLLSDGLIRSAVLGSGEWKAWSSLLSFRLINMRGFAILIRSAEEEGGKFLPPMLNDLAQNNDFLSAEHAELALVLPRFGRILKWLSVVGKMLAADEPLKPALLIFARVNEQIFELTNYINNRLESFPDDEAELFASLDAAAYTASIELKKVYSQELAGVAGMRPSPTIYARIETAHSLLNEGFQQMLAGFARLLDPKADIFSLFPIFQQKLDRSIRVRKELWAAVTVVQEAEKNPGKPQIEKLHKILSELMKGSAGFLFYKDTETIERFVEEILVTKQNKDLVPTLHRFGAFLETLFGQVNLRAVLEKHPFDSKN